MPSPALTSETGASTPTRNVRGVSPTHISSPGFDSRYNGDHVSVVFHSPSLVEIVPRTAAEWRKIEADERRASRELTARNKACRTGTPNGPMRHRRNKGNRRRRG